MKKKLKKKSHQPAMGPRGGKRSSVVGIPYQVCKRCGLIYLNNDATRKAIQSGCEAFDDEGT